MDDHDEHDEQEDAYWYEKRNKGPKTIFDDDKTTTTTSTRTKSVLDEIPSSLIKTITTTTTTTSTRPKSVLDEIPSSMPFKKPTFGTNKQTTKSDSSPPSNKPASGVSVRLKDEKINFNNDAISKEIKYKTEIANKNAQIITIMKNAEEPDIRQTIERILNDKPFYFDLYKNKSQKIELLDEAISTYDGNAILAVVLYLKRTLTPEIFRSIIITRQIALNHYVYYLEQMKCFKELSEIYKQQGKHTDAALNEYRLINSNKNNKNNDDIDNYHEKIKILNEVKNNYANEISKIAQKQLQLIEFQKRLEMPHNELIASTITTTTTNKLDDTLHDAVYYYCKNYHNLNRLHAEYSIDSLKQTFELNNKLFACVNVKALCENGAWTELDKFTKSSQGLFSKRSLDISWETMISIICASSTSVNGVPNAPLAELIKYARLIENIQIRNQIAVKYKIYDVAIETFVALKDKNGLINYKNKLPQNSPESVKALKAINESNWK